MCGGTMMLCPEHNIEWGLSPRVRGNPIPGWSCTSGFGSIPACAGEPASRSLMRISVTVYPRVCGGTKFSYTCSTAAMGLSPRVRGNRWSCTFGFADRRSIPACAGEPASRSLMRISVTVYPRVCGGTCSTRHLASCCHGLSPRVRGNRVPRPLPGQARRSIPACAGEPLPGVHRPGHTPVYPRVCGGTVLAVNTGMLLLGLSPRVRGNQCWALGWGIAIRSIPACAGEPSRLP